MDKYLRLHYTTTTIEKALCFVEHHVGHVQSLETWAGVTGQFNQFFRSRLRFILGLPKIHFQFSEKFLWPTYTMDDGTILHHHLPSGEIHQGPGGMCEHRSCVVDSVLYS